MRILKKAKFNNFYKLIKKLMLIQNGTTLLFMLTKPQ